MEHVANDLVGAHIFAALERFLKADQGALASQAKEWSLLDEACLQATRAWTNVKEAAIAAYSTTKTYALKSYEMTKTGVCIACSWVLALFGKQSNPTKKAEVKEDESSARMQPEAAPAEQEPTVEVQGGEHLFLRHVWTYQQWCNKFARGKKVSFKEYVAGYRKQAGLRTFEGPSEPTAQEAGSSSASLSDSALFDAFVYKISDKTEYQAFFKSIAQEHGIELHNKVEVLKVGEDTTWLAFFFADAWFIVNNEGLYARSTWFGREIEAKMTTLAKIAATKQAEEFIPVIEAHFPKQRAELTAKL